MYTQTASIRYVFHTLMRTPLPPPPQRFACKTFMVSSVPKKKAQRRILETLRNEIDLLRSLDHPNIVRAYESYEVGQDLHLVMELCRGGGEWRFFCRLLFQQ